MSALPQYAPLEISKAVSADSIALGFIKNADAGFEFVGPLASEVEKFFGLNLADELTFFSLLVQDLYCYLSRFLLQQY